MSYKKTKVVNKSLNFACSVSKTRSLPSSPDVDKKVVHFADAEGKTLANIKTYVPSYDDLDALRKVFLRQNGPFPDDNKNISGETDGTADFTQTRFLKLKGSSTKLSKKLMVSRGIETSNGFLSKCFELDMTDIDEKIQRQQIILEDVIIVGRDIQGRVIVTNIAFEKHVYVRHTFDEWLTFEEIEANYVPFSNEGDMDRFMFSLTVPKKCKTVSFALKYCVSGKEYWDNNSGKNYKIADISK